MADKLMIVCVRGREHEWVFEFYGDPQYLDEWREDGLEIEVIANVIPSWIAELGLSEPWCFLQDIFHFKNPFKRGKS